MVDGGPGPLDGVRVVEFATLAAGPMVGTALGEFGAEIIKVEQPGAGDPMRTWGDRRDGIGLVWKSVSRNKRCVTLDLRRDEGQTLFHDLLAVSDVLIVGNRPSALERWGIDYDAVHAAHPHVVMVHITGYGKGGPKSDRPGFGTLAEAMSGFAHLTGQPDGPPTLPPFMLADGVAALAATYAVMIALYHRDLNGGGGQLVDVNLIEPLARLMESSTLGYDQLGVVQGRVGNMLPASAPRNAYRTSDDRWLAISSAAPNIAVRLFRAARTSPTTRTTSTPSAVLCMRSNWTSWSRAGWGNGRSTRRWRSSRRPRSPLPPSTTRRNCWPTSTCGPGARSCPSRTRTSARSRSRARSSS